MPWSNFDLFKRLWVLVRTASPEAVLKCTHNQCFEQIFQKCQIFRMKILILQLKKSLYIAWASYRNGNVFRKRSGWALIGACALITTNTVNIFNFDPDIRLSFY